MSAELQGDEGILRKLTKTKIKITVCVWYDVELFCKTINLQIITLKNIFQLFLHCCISEDVKNLSPLFCNLFLNALKFVLPNFLI